MFSWFMGGDAEAKPIHPAVEKVIADAPELAKYIDQVRTANFSLFLERSVGKKTLRSAQTDGVGVQTAALTAVKSNKLQPACT